MTGYPDAHAVDPLPAHSSFFAWEQGQGVPLRMPNGILRNRMSLILAVLSKHARMKLFASDIHVNVGGRAGCH